MFIYLLILCIFMYINAFYFGLILRFPETMKKINRTEKSILIFFLNIIVGGSGTFLIGYLKLVYSSAYLKGSERVKDFFFGIIQLIGFILFLLAICSFDDKNNKILDDNIPNIFLLVIGILAYLFSLCSSFQYCLEINNPSNDFYDTRVFIIN